MNDEPRSSGRTPPPPLPEADAYIRRLDPDYVALVHDVGKIENKMEDVEEQLKALKASSFRQERFTVGGWSDDGSTYITGMRERVEGLGNSFKWMASGFWALALLFAGDLLARAFGIKI